MTSDIRVAFRLLWKDKAFTLTAALTLALCIGANTALFSVVHNVLLRPLPVPESDQIMLMGNAYPGAGVAIGGSSGVPDYYDRLRDVTVFEEQALYTGRNHSIDQNGTPTRVRGTRATPSYFRLLRVAPALGRTFTEQEGEPGNDKKAVLSYALWQSQFGGDPQAIGKDIRLDGQPYTIVGVMPKGFYFLNPDVMLWTPLAFTADQKGDAAASQQQLAEHRAAQAGRDHSAGAAAGRRAECRQSRSLSSVQRPARSTQGSTRPSSALQDTLVKDVKATLYLMWGGALFVLLIGCVNVANLVLVRSRARMKELATRLALGAGRWRVGRQLVTESVLLTLRVGRRRTPGRVRRAQAPGHAEHPGTAARRGDPPRRRRRRVHARGGRGDRVRARTHSRSRTCCRPTSPVSCAKKAGAARQASARALCDVPSSSRRSGSRSCCSSAPACCSRASAR